MISSNNINSIEQTKMIKKCQSLPAENEIELQKRLANYIHSKKNEEWSSHVAKFLEEISEATDGRCYIYGGLLRDLALIGSEAICSSSDIDVVVDDDMEKIRKLLTQGNLERNKFGGYRMKIFGKQIDLWSAKHSWFFQNGSFAFEGISSLTKTTILNWDAILLNWKTKKVIASENYFELVNSKTLEILNTCNPNPLGMTVKILRNICQKSPSHITPESIVEINKLINQYSIKKIIHYEKNNYEVQYINDSYLHYLKHDGAL